MGDQSRLKYWQISLELPPEVFAALRKPGNAINPIAVVATVDADGAPRTAPFGSLRAVTPRRLRFACLRAHDTYTNVCRDGRVMVSFLAPPAVAVSIGGRARVVQETMKADERAALLEVDVEQVKNDLSFRGAIESGVELDIPQTHIGWYLAIVDEVANYGTA